FVFREEYYAERSKPPADDTNKMDEWYQKMIALHNKAEVIIGKQRHGPLANISLTFLGEYTRFSNWADENSHNAN
ncbi:MAG: replicative DNA helicase, partial [Aestuariivita sp.]|nr:replicative DNA helicase [Aestuariivita sp.]